MTGPDVALAGNTHRSIASRLALTPVLAVNLTLIGPVPFAGRSGIRFAHAGVNALANVPGLDALGVVPRPSETGPSSSAAVHARRASMPRLQP
jgi:hypothetical protein